MRAMGVLSPKTLRQEKKDVRSKSNSSWAESLLNDEADDSIASQKEILWLIRDQSNLCARRLLWSA
jgi:hypothetical protein